MAASSRARAQLEQQLRSRIGRQIADLRLDAGITGAALARCAGIDPGHIWRIEAGRSSPSIRALVAIASCLSAEPGIRLFPIAGPRILDRFQAPMIDALIRSVGPDWRTRPEVPAPSARGVVDLVLTRSLDHLTVVCECHSELRRLELVIRRLAEKAEAMGSQVDSAGTLSTLLLLRSTSATRALARTYESTLAAAFPARSADALAALTGRAAWPGAAIVWARVEGGRAEILDGPPRGVRLGR